jgi:hypothetical protein
MVKVYRAIVRPGPIYSLKFDFIRAECHENLSSHCCVTVRRLVKTLSDSTDINY